MGRRVLVLLLVISGVAQIASGQTDSLENELKTAAAEFADRSVQGDFTTVGGAEPSPRKDTGLAMSKGSPRSREVPEKTVASKPDSQQALLDLLKVHEAWKTTRGSEKVLIGVIDNGFDFYHPALKNKIIPGYYYSGGYHSEFFTNMAHGTLVASIIVAQKQGDEGMTGLAPACTVVTASQGMIEHTLLKLRSAWIKEHPDASPAESNKARIDIMRKHRNEILKFGKDWVRYQFSGAAKAIRYLTDRGVRVINFSGYVTRSAVGTETELWKEIESAFAYAAKKNVVIVLGAGNNGRLTEDYPGSVDTVIVAGASNLDDTRWTTEIKAMGTTIMQGSDFGARLTVMAPTENIRVCVPHAERFYSCDDSPIGEEKQEFKGLYDSLPSGATSSAAPIVTSLVALIYSVRPELDAKSVVAIVAQGCDDVAEGGYDLYTGYGRVNFQKSLELAAQVNDEKIAETKRSLEAAARRFALLGNEIELEAIQRDGSRFDWSSYRGKVVLVDFFATSSPEWRAALLAFKLNYRLYHDRGLEVVGISTDKDRQTLEAFLKTEPLPWVTLHEEDVKEPQPLTTYYGVTNVPTSWLVSREGKVVSLRARGDELDSQLAELIGPPDAGKTKLEVIVPVGATWKWLHSTDGVDPATNDENFHTTFFNRDYDDSQWETGQDSAGRTGGFGYGDSVGVVWSRPEPGHRKTAYLRHKFRTTTSAENLVLSLQHDDGIIVYLDGKEVGRDNVGDRKEAHDLLATSTISGREETRVNRLYLTGSLGPGEHVLAISLHNRAHGSSDLRIAEISLHGVRRELSSQAPLHPRRASRTETTSGASRSPVLVQRS